MGTLEYMAPEVLQKEPTSAASDVYAWGVAVNEVATGMFPFSDCTKDNPQCQTILNFGYGRRGPQAAYPPVKIYSCLPYPPTPLAAGRFVKLSCLHHCACMQLKLLARAVPREQGRAWHEAVQGSVILAMHAVAVVHCWRMHTGRSWRRRSLRRACGLFWRPTRPARLAALLEAAWQLAPSRRPTAAHLEAELRALLAEMDATAADGVPASTIGAPEPGPAANGAHAGGAALPSEPGGDEAGAAMAPDLAAGDWGRAAWEGDSSNAAFQPVVPS